MKRPIVFGSTGAVGRACLDVLARHPQSLVIAGRDEARLRDVASSVGADIDVAVVDIVDTAAVAAAISGRDGVVNCAGPSEQFSAGVGAAAIAAGVPYVDPGGDPVLLDRLAAATPTAPVVLQAGVQPGLSGLLLRVLAAHVDGDVDSITAWCGGLQPLTSASIMEYLASLHDEHSHPGAELRDGAIRPVTRGERKNAPPQYFPGSATVHPHLDSETVAMAERLGIGNVCWMSVFDGAHTTQAMQLLAIDDQRHGDLAEVLAASKLDLFGRRRYFSIVGSAGATKVAFTCPDSYRVTGALAAFAALNVDDMTAGVHPLSCIEEPLRAFDFVTDSVPGAELTILDDAATEMDEGSL